MHTLHGKLLLVAGHAEVMVVLRDKALGADGLLASMAGETGLVPAVPLVLHLPGAFNESYKVRIMNTVEQLMWLFSIICIYSILHYVRGQIQGNNFLYQNAAMINSKEGIYHYRGGVLSELVNGTSISNTLHTD